MSGKNFIELCLDGEALIQDIDDFVSNWHEKPSTNSLQEYLGMSAKEYNAWMLDEAVLPYIIKAHKNDEDFSDIYLDTDVKIAARGANTEQVEQLLFWLKENE